MELLTHRIVHKLLTKFDTTGLVQNIKNMKDEDGATVAVMEFV